MRFEPDLIIPSDDGTAFSLVVEVKLQRPGDAEIAQLKKYMMAMRCPLAVMVTPSTVEILRDTYADFSPAAIESVGRYPAPELLSRASHQGESEFERCAQEWLQGLVAASRRAELRDDLRAAVEEYLVPVLESGELSAARARRHQLTGS